MSDKNIDVKITGGNVNIGSVSQGDHNKAAVDSQEIVANFDRDFLEFFQHVNNLQPERGVSRKELDSLITEVKSIRDLFEKGASRSSIIDGAKELYEKYGWAADALKKLFTTIFI